jgi:ribosomal protein S27E
VSPQDRKHLENFRFTPEVIVRTDEVLQVWGEPELFAKCPYCGKVCFQPDLPPGKHLRKKLLRTCSSSESWLGSGIVPARSSAYCATTLSSSTGGTDQRSEST